ILFSTVGPTFPRVEGGWGFHYASPAKKYEAGSGGAASNLFWFDPVTAGPLPTTYNTINTGSIITVALTLDRAGNIYGIDQGNVLHMWDKANSYALDPIDLGYPKDLTVLPEVGPPSTRKIHDMVYNERNKELLMLWQENSNNAEIVKLQCDLTDVTSTTPANIGSVDWGWPADIGMDQVDNTGALLASQGEAQLFTCNGQQAGIKIWNSATLTQYQSTNWWTYGNSSFAYPFASVSIALNGCPIGASIAWTGCVIGFTVPAGGPSAGWQ
ncbi:MAG: hypothetical protein ABI743_14355, partial [bacterium]